jgi:hypothetical protein
MGQPVKPATTPSLPGAQSTRTDGGIANKQTVKKMIGMAYGENTDYNQIAGSAPLEKAVDTKPLSPTDIASAGNRKQQPQQVQPQQDAGFASLTGTPETNPNPTSVAGVASPMATPTPTEMMARALYAINPTENLRRVVAQFDKELG